MTRCWIIVTSDLVDHARIQEAVETLVTANGGVHHLNGVLRTLSDMNVLLQDHPIVSVSTEIDEFGRLALGNALNAIHEEDPERDGNTLLERYIKTRRKLQSVSRHLRKLLWDWIPERVCEFRALRARQLVDPGDFSIGSHFGEFVLTGTIGNGLSGATFSCAKPGESRPLALKMMRKSNLLTTKAITRASSEITLLHGQDPDALHRRNILPILEVVHSSSFMCYTFELFGTSLCEFSMNMNEDIGLREFNTKEVITAMHDALEHVHSHGYAHRDVKGENILVRPASGKGRYITDVRLTNFGIVCRLDDETALGEMCGTPGFIAPEVITRQVQDGRKVDVWALGCVVLDRSVDNDWFEDNWFTPNAHLNYGDGSATQDLSPLQHAVFNSLQFLAENNDAAVFDFVRQALVLDPTQRPNADELTLGWMLQP